MGDARGIEQTEEVRLLAALCRELAKQGLDVGMSDAKPALSVRRRRYAPRLWILVDAGFFEWGCGRRHAVTDPAGTAARIAGDVRRSIS
ncbi:hypothetical protein [Actinomadura sp. DC4]|uniref:hypothetical protein n=1 Tax=Actinomadura sp. DC4 TaxID=3055069 RepID=UPI0025B1C8A7|nr:hypothetical protein [Actinomadura sp. DC4]MDN3352922.1 hypothetical protein [Actinomadura sp. DC4]